MTTPIPLAVKLARAPTGLAWFTPIWPWAFPRPAPCAWRHRGQPCGASPLRLLDRLAAQARCLWTPRPTCSPGARQNAPPGCSNGTDAGENLRGIPGTAWLDKLEQTPDGPRPTQSTAGNGPGPLRALPAHDEILADPVKLLTMTQELERQVHRLDAWAFQPVGDRAVVLARPAPPDHAGNGRPVRNPLYPAIPPQLQGSHPGGGNDAHQHYQPSRLWWRVLLLLPGPASRPPHQLPIRSSVLDEARLLGQENMDRGKGPVAISDVGGPTANMWQGHCALRC